MGSLFQMHVALLALGSSFVTACQDGESRQLLFPADYMFGNRRLVKHVIATIKVFDFDLCEVQCYHQPNCVSINFNVISDSKGLHECELNNGTHRSHHNELINKDGYLYKGAETNCDGAVCENGGTCQSGFTDKGYRCVCPLGFTSAHCEQDVNECEKGQINLCDKHAFCSNIKGSYSCHCKQGFVGNGFNCTLKISHVSAWFPLNGTYHTSEIENRSATGSKGDKVYLSLGPDGTQNGSYFFRGSGDSHINFSDINLDIRGSITILCWLYIYENNSDTVFLQYKDTKLSVFVYGNTLTLKNANSNGQLLTGTLAEKALGWRFVGVSYNEASAEAQLWIDGNEVNSTGLPADFIFHGTHFLMLGGNNFTGKITQLLLFNSTLTQEQIQGVKEKIKLPAMIFNSTILNNSFYRAGLASFLAPVVGQIESKWKLCHNALAHGWDNEIFHRNCDNKRHTVTIIEKKPYIFGGYTDIPWGSRYGWGETHKAFIFSLKNNEGLPPFKCFVKNGKNAIFNRRYFGPTFGNHPGLRIRRGFSEVGAKAMATISESYSVPTGVKNTYKVLAGTTGYFFFDNYEVFYLV